jgi:4-hydroxybenzoate polyprenyltransferase
MQIAGLLRTMRPRQWIKNGFVFVALIFDRKLFEPRYVLLAIAGFLLLCLASSVVYIINDLADIEADRQHPTKKLRPLPSGQLSTRFAAISAVLIAVVTSVLAFLLRPLFGAITVLYVLLQIAYSAKLKHIVILDVLALASGFVLRVAAGVALVDVARFSPWLYIFTTMLSLFLGFGKRRQEIVLLEGNAGNHRMILDQYNLALLDEIIVITTTATILTYALYTFSAEGLPADHSMMLTIPFVLYIIFRYLYLIHVKDEGGAPEEVLLTDRPIQAAVALGGITIVAILYFLR